MPRKPTFKPRAHSAPETVSRATFEAYIGIAIAIIQVVWQSMMVYLKIAFLVVLIVIVCDVLWRHKSTAAIRKREKIPLIVLVIGLILTFAIPQLRDDWRDEFGVKPGLEYLTTYGGCGPFAANTETRQFQGALCGRMMVDGRLLKNLRDRYKLVGFVYHHSHSMDVHDEPIAAQSGPYDIQATDIDIVIPWSSLYEEEILNGMRLTAYTLIAVPNSVGAKRFSTIRDALNHGSLIISERAGPP